MTESLWPHQTRVIEAVREAFNRGKRRILVVIPTGGGKSRVGSALSVFGDTVVATHTRELARQSESSFGTGVRVVTVQGTARPVARMVIVDEAHRYASTRWRELFEHYSDSVIVGLTATPCRADGRALDMFEELVVGAQYSELIEGGLIVPAEVYYPAKRRVKGLAMNPVEAYLKFGAGRSGFFYSNRSTHAEEIAEGLRHAGVRAECIGSHVADKHRDTIIKAFLNRDIDVLTNVNALTEGFNAPWASFVGLASPCSHVATYLQRAGRGARSFPGKTGYVLVDLCGAYFEHGSPTEDRIYSLTGQPIRASERLGSLSSCLGCGYCWDTGGPCPRCGYAPKVKQNPLLVRNVGLRRAVERKNTDDGLAELIKIRGNRSWYWIGSEYRKLFGKWPDLRFVTFDERKRELDRLKADAIRLGRKQGYAFVMFGKIFGEQT
jgi:superfamily II DNA or RNA helicase